MTKLQEIIHEVHRRSLWQVLTIYLVGAWIGYEVILSLTEGVGLPEWVPVFAIVLFIIGLPIVLATAFVQEGLSGGGAAAGQPDERAGEVGDRPMDAPATSGGPRLTWSRSIAAGIAAFVLLAGVSGSYMWLRSAGVGPMGSLVGQGELDAGEPLLVADFTSPSGDSVLARVLTSAFRTDLSQSSLIRPADRGQIDAALRLMERPSSSQLDAELAHEVAARLGLRAVVVGEVGRAGGGYALNARIESADSARVLAAFQAIASDSTELLDAIQELSRSVRERAGESLRTLRASYPLSQVTTASLPALRKYTEAHRMEYEVGDRERALRLLDEALELDPGFAMAYFLQAIIAYNREEGGEALRAIEAARSHEDRLTAWERHSVRQLGAAIRGDFRQAEHELREQMALRPSDPTPWFRLSDNRYYEGRFEESEEAALRAVELGSRAGATIWNLMVARNSQGKYDAGRETARLADSLGTPYARTVAWMTAWAAGDIEEIRRLGEDLPRGWRYDEHRLSGRLDSANAMLMDAAADAPAFRPQVPVRLAADHLFIRGGDLAARDGDDDGIGALADQALAGMPENYGARNLVRAALILAVAGRTEASATARAAYDERVPTEARKRHAHYLLAQEAYMALAAGDPDRAFDLLRQARRATPWTAPIDALLGRAHDLLDRPDSAIAAYTRYLETPWYDRKETLLGDPVLRGPTLERLALLHDDAGRSAQAVRYAAELVELWEGADAVLQPRVDRVRGILERAAAEGS